MPISGTQLASLPVTTESATASAANVGTDELPLRNACDSCNAAKVKCSRDRPSCRRCHSRNISCVYGVSLRGVKRAAYKRHEKNSLRTPSLQEPFSPSTTPRFPEELLQDWDYNFPSDSFPSKEIDLDNQFNLLNPPLADSYNPTSVAARATNLPTPPHSSTSTSHASLFGTTCYCQSILPQELAKLGVRPQSETVAFDEFLIKHKATMAVCISVLECTSPHHKQGILVLVELVALLIHILEGFDRVICGLDSQGRQSPTSVRLSLGSYQLDQGEERVLQANLLRIELAKVGVLIQSLNQQYSPTINGTRTGDISLISPLLADLKKQARAKFDRIRGWEPCL
ncbi:hypothetical protein BDV38DRAFT_282744 [Aspergillus pseudotamarii]|uniref:Zn(2)-C6 fungal-type domain-containing protein n=1 Tax=Aspergillus pseudotamarii TaxID=132259 RepID=A0A5N6SXG5_ASPPS|nr:uncharacterized protein BDV38DRAFT_282744 [Aspergillus pseudotamarii]KAE8137814.1 hypothetical protein BDV38DRAFT_282744 [Aspergillus pseudotamarii]